MNNVKIKTLLFGLLLVVSLGLKAQEKYEYGSVEFRYAGAPGYSLSISLSSGFNEKKIDKKEFTGTNGLTDITPLIREVNELNKKGWEVYNVTYTTFCVIYSIRKKI